MVGITDGDTVTVLDAFKVQHKIRLSGIDAPERSPSYGHASRRHLARIVFGKTVTIVTARRDRYGREVGKVIADRVDANLVQLRSGLAWHFKRYAHDQPVADRGPYAQTEADARKARHGSWHDAQPTPPGRFDKRGESKRARWVSGKKDVCASLGAGEIQHRSGLDRRLLPLLPPGASGTRGRRRSNRVRADLTLTPKRQVSAAAGFPADAIAVPARLNAGIMYGRDVGKILINRQNANIEQVCAGFAWHYKQYEHEQPVADQPPYSLLKSIAMRDLACSAISVRPPWDYRKIRRRQ